MSKSGSKNIAAQTAYKQKKYLQKIKQNRKVLYATVKKKILTTLQTKLEQETITTQTGRQFTFVTELVEGFEQLQDNEKAAITRSISNKVTTFKQTIKKSLLLEKEKRDEINETGNKEEIKEVCNDPGCKQKIKNLNDTIEERNRQIQELNHQIVRLTNQNSKESNSGARWRNHCLAQRDQLEKLHQQDEDKDLDVDWLKRFKTHISNADRVTQNTAGVKQYSPATITNMKKWLEPYCKWMQKSGLQEPTQLSLMHYFEESKYSLGSQNRIAAEIVRFTNRTQDKRFFYTKPVKVVLTRHLVMPRMFLDQLVIMLENDIINKIEECSSDIAEMRMIAVLLAVLIVTKTGCRPSEAESIVTKPNLLTDIRNAQQEHKGYKFGEIAYHVEVPRFMTKTKQRYLWYLKHKDGETIFKAWTHISEVRDELFNKASMYQTLKTQFSFYVQRTLALKKFTKLKKLGEPGIDGETQASTGYNPRSVRCLFAEEWIRERMIRKYSNELETPNPLQHKQLATTLEVYGKDLNFTDNEAFQIGEMRKQQKKQDKKSAKRRNVLRKQREMKAQVKQNVKVKLAVKKINESSTRTAAKITPRDIALPTPDLTQTVTPRNAKAATRGMSTLDTELSKKRQLRDQTSEVY